MKIMKRRLKREDFSHQKSEKYLKKDQDDYERWNCLGIII